MAIAFGSPEALKIVNESKKRGETITFHYENISETYYHRADGTVTQIELTIKKNKETEEVRHTAKTE